MPTGTHGYSRVLTGTHGGPRVLTGTHGYSQVLTGADGCSCVGRWTAGAGRRRSNRQQQCNGEHARCNVQPATCCVATHTAASVATAGGRMPPGISTRARGIQPPTAGANVPRRGPKRARRQRCSHGHPVATRAALPPGREYSSTLPSARLTARPPAVSTQVPVSTGAALPPGPCWERPRWRGNNAGGQASRPRWRGRAGGRDGGRAGGRDGTRVLAVDGRAGGRKGRRRRRARDAQTLGVSAISRSRSGGKSFGCGDVKRTRMSGSTAATRRSSSVKLPAGGQAAPRRVAAAAVARLWAMMPRRMRVPRRGDCVTRPRRRRTA